MIFRVIIAIILIQTLRFKFTISRQYLYFFKGRIGIFWANWSWNRGAPSCNSYISTKTVWAGALLAIGVLGDAIMMHLSSLGIKINDDSGVLFFTTSITFSVSLIVLYPYRKRYYFYGHNSLKP